VIYNNEVTMQSNAKQNLGAGIMPRSPSNNKVTITKRGTIPYVRHGFLISRSRQKMSWPWNPGQRSLKVIEWGTIRQIIYGFS